MITLQDLSAYLEHLMPSKDFPDYAPNGLQVEGKKEIQQIAFAVSAGSVAIQRAIELKADALIVHHGIFWQKDPLIVTGSKRRRLGLLLTQGLSLFAYHLPLDVHPKIGNNYKAAQDLGFFEITPFGPSGKVCLGVKGQCMPTPVAEFRKKLETYYKHPAHVVLEGKEVITSFALISGGGHRYLEQAADENLDCLITGTFDEPVWDIAQERDIHFFALGHYATERIGIMALMEKVKHHFSLPCSFIDVVNPF